MRKLLAKIWDVLGQDIYSYQQKQMERYLSESIDLVDLERRQRQLTYGQVKL